MLAWLTRVVLYCTGDSAPWLLVVAVLVVLGELADGRGAQTVIGRLCRDSVAVAAATMLVRAGLLPAAVAGIL